MSRTALVAWGVALLLAVAGAAAVVHARSSCAHLTPKECTQTRTQEYRTLLMGGLAAVAIVMGTTIAVALRRR